MCQLARRCRLGWQPGYRSGGGPLVAITGYGLSTPDRIAQDDLWTGFFQRHYGDNPIARRIFASSSVVTRGAAADPRLEDMSGWSTARRMERFVPEATRLGAAAARQALIDANLDADQVGMFAMVSCTGYATPGADVLLTQQLDLPANVRRLLLGHMGCHASLPALDAVSDYVTTQNKAALLVSVELPSIHLQPADDDVEQFVAHALFGDGASALVVQGNAYGPSLHPKDSESASLTDVADLMTWHITDHGFRMGLSSRLPEVLQKEVRATVERLLMRNGLDMNGVSKWAVHPGGPRILDVVESELGLPSDALQASRRVLADYGNCSSATVLMVLRDLIADVQPGDCVVALAFGPGLTLYASLLEFR